MAKKTPGNKWDRLYVAVVVPYKTGTFEIDYDAYRKLIRYFLQKKFVDAGVGLVANPEAGEIFYLTYEEKKKIVEIAVEEVAGKVPLFAGAFAMTTDGIVRDAVAAKKLGADGIFFIPPTGSGDITSCWNPDKYPEVWLDVFKAIDKAVNLPIIAHPTTNVSIYGGGLPVGPTLAICREVRNVVGWKMTYSYYGWKTIAEGLRTLDHHVGILGAPSDLWHVFLMNEMFDGTVNGGFCYAMEPMLDHILAWKSNDLAAARKIWNSGLSKLNDFVYGDFARLHVRYKIGAWLRGFVPEPFMRPPQPVCKVDEIKEMQKHLKNVGLKVIPDKEVKRVLAKL